MNCPICHCVAEEKWLISTKFWYCTSCKEDIEFLRSKTSSGDKGLLDVPDELFKIGDDVVYDGKDGTIINIIGTSYMVQCQLVPNDPLSTTIYLVDNKKALKKKGISYFSTTFTYTPQISSRNGYNVVLNSTTKNFKAGDKVLVSPVGQPSYYAIVMSYYKPYVSLDVGYMVSENICTLVP